MFNHEGVTCYMCNRTQPTAIQTAWAKKRPFERGQSFGVQQLPSLTLCLVIILYGYY